MFTASYDLYRNSIKFLCTFQPKRLCISHSKFGCMPLILATCFGLSKLNALLWQRVPVWIVQFKRHLAKRLNSFYQFVPHCVSVQITNMLQSGVWVCIKASLPTTGCQLSLFLATCHHIPNATYRNITAANMSITCPHAVSNQIYGDAKRICVMSTVCA